ncbi:carboxynorspermidine decarboxylase [Sporanaerobium hydrogeniformans]|uniref:Carboxynorspermidine decarboxylase n=1 Tax=Sporanaerobium hydrogeniformans TaxID=3072179 RepID=A0AC61DGB6_9FIRM|nr:carboxynorspermidine decarboxylase [Sporanaerobium hydrogeniformans]PHV72241.1 carboxynorspermidine decarboxylase [Sporanaerobium hydrogeniformans]
MGIPFEKIPTPSYVVDEDLLRKNLERLQYVEQKAGCHILLAQKAFSMYSTFPLIAKYLSGVTSSSLFEARLGYEEMGKEVHIYAPAYKEEEFEEIMTYCDHIVFNSLQQWGRYKEKVANNVKKIGCGLRINPEYSEITTDLYNPCFPGSRFGEKSSQLSREALEGLEGLHFHTLCEQNADALIHTLERVEEKFGKYLYDMKWLNMGGGHHITREDYEVEALIKVIQHIKKKYDLEIYLEPGEAVALNTGYLVATVLDTFENDKLLGILDASAACHMPDVLEMPYRPFIIGSGKEGEYPYTYRLGGATCLAGDVIGDYSFKKPLQPGDKLVFCDMAHYTMVKNNTFNGVNLPSILLYSEETGFRLIKEFAYEDFKSRL